MPTGSETVHSGETRTPTQVLALRLLDPWVAGDKRKLQFELQNWERRSDALKVEVDPRDEGCFELLDCLVAQMSSEPDLFAPRSEKMHLGVWVDLLTHLAHPAR